MGQSCVYFLKTALAKEEDGLVIDVGCLLDVKYEGELGPVGDLDLVFLLNPQGVKLRGEGC